ncbi:MAG: hypothetical protein QM639_01235 [Rhodocyclaceae bacterium]
MNKRLATMVFSVRRLLLALLLLGTLVQPGWARTPSPFTFPSIVKVPAWIGEFRWLMRMEDHTGDPFRLRLGFTALPNGDWSVTGSLLLDDAELGSIGSARLSEGRLVVDLLVSGSVRNVPPDDDKRALYPPGQVPARISSAGLATIRIELDPRRLDGTASMYMVNVVSGNLAQGPFYAESTVTLDDE